MLEEGMCLDQLLAQAVDFDPTRASEGESLGLIHPAGAADLRIRSEILMDRKPIRGRAHLHSAPEPVYHALDTSKSNRLAIRRLHSDAQ